MSDMSTFLQMLLLQIHQPCTDLNTMQLDYIMYDIKSFNMSEVEGWIIEELCNKEFNIST